MKNKNYLYPSGEFAKLAGVNKRTLHYYNDIGLFCPEIIADSQMMEKKKKLIDESIKQLLTVQSFLEQKAQRLKIGFEAQDGTIELCSLPERKIVVSSPISGKYDEKDFSVAAEFSLRLKKLFHLYESFGSRISVTALQNMQFNCYDSFFTFCPPSERIYDEILPAGTYLRAYCIGKWEKLPDLYKKILIFAQKKNLTLTDYAYEEGLNEMAIRTQDDYVTMITIPCQKS